MANTKTPKFTHSKTASPILLFSPGVLFNFDAPESRQNYDFLLNNLDRLHAAGIKFTFDLRDSGDMTSQQLVAIRNSGFKGDVSAVYISPKQQPKLMVEQTNYLSNIPAVVLSPRETIEAGTRAPAGHEDFKAFLEEQISTGNDFRIGILSGRGSSSGITSIGGGKAKGKQVG